MLRAEPDIDFRTAHEAGFRKVPDNLVLLASKQEHRILVTHDRRTMPYYFADLIQKEESPGVFLVSENVPIGLAIEFLLLIWHTTEAEEWANSITEIPF